MPYCVAGIGRTLIRTHLNLVMMSPLIRHPLLHGDLTILGYAILPSDFKFACYKHRKPQIPGLNFIKLIITYNAGGLT